MPYLQWAVFAACFGKNAAPSPSCESTFSCCRCWFRPGSQQRALQLTFLLQNSRQASPELTFFDRKEQAASVLTPYHRRATKSYQGELAGLEVFVSQSRWQLAVSFEGWWSAEATSILDGLVPSGIALRSQVCKPIAVKVISTGLRGLHGGRSFCTGCNPFSIARSTT